MTRLLLLADDLTGALDTGVFFPGAQVFPDAAVSAQAPFRLLCLDSRHLSPQDAAARTMQAVSENNAEMIYIKTDSLLRGHAGAQLGALAQMRGPVFFAPAYPANGRTTVNGVVYVHGVRLSETAAAQDPLNPVKSDAVRDILAQESDVEVISIQPGDPIQKDFRGVVLCNTATDADLDAAARQALALGFRNFAGCAGFARALSEALYGHSRDAQLRLRSTRLLVLSASIHPATFEQLSTARSLGIPGVWLYDGGHGEQQLGAAAAKTARLLKSSPCTMLAAAFNDTQHSKNANFCKSLHIAAQDAARQITSELSNCAVHALAHAAATPFVIGGDTLRAFCGATGLVSITPHASLAPGIIYCMAYDQRGREKALITKSGGFGDAACILDLADQFAR